MIKSPICTYIHAHRPYRHSLTYVRVALHKPLCNLTFVCQNHNHYPKTTYTHNHTWTYTYVMYAVYVLCADNPVTTDTVSKV